MKIEDIEFLENVSDFLLGMSVIIGNYKDGKNSSQMMIDSSLRMREIAKEEYLQLKLGEMLNGKNNEQR